jgi:hypothetical protein
MRLQKQKKRSLASSPSRPGSRTSRARLDARRRACRSARHGRAGVLCSILTVLFLRFSLPLPEPGNANASVSATRAAGRPLSLAPPPGMLRARSPAPTAQAPASPQPSAAPPHRRHYRPHFGELVGAAVTTFAAASLNHVALAHDLANIHETGPCPSLCTSSCMSLSSLSVLILALARPCSLSHPTLFPLARNSPDDHRRRAPSRCRPRHRARPRPASPVLSCISAIEPRGIMHYRRCRCPVAFLSSPFTSRRRHGTRFRPCGVVDNLEVDRASRATGGATVSLSTILHVVSAASAPHGELLFVSCPLLGRGRAARCGLSRKSLPRAARFPSDDCMQLCMPPLISSSFSFLWPACRSIGLLVSFGPL